MLAAKSSMLCMLLYFGYVTAKVNITFDRTVTYNIRDHFPLNVNTHKSLLTIVTYRDDDTKLFGPLRIIFVSQLAMDSESKAAKCSSFYGTKSVLISGHSFAANRSILVSKSMKIGEEKYVVYKIVNFSVNIFVCTTFEAKIEFESSDAATTNYRENKDAILINDDDTFDVLYNDTRACGNKICKLTIDAQGNKASGPTGSFVPLAGSYRLANKMPSSLNFVVEEWRSDGLVRVSLIKPDGQVVLKEYKSSDAHKSHDVSQGSIRICLRRNNNTKVVDCELFDESGNVTSKISTDTKQKVYQFVVRNLVNGEFLLFVGGEDTFVVMKVRSDGSVIGVVDLPHFTHRIPFNPQIYFDVSYDQYCATKKGYNLYGLEVIRACFGDSDFH